MKLQVVTYTLFEDGDSTTIPAYKILEVLDSAKFKSTIPGRYYWEIVVLIEIK